MFSQYNAQGELEELTDHVCKTLMIQGAPEPLRTHLQVAEQSLSFAAFKNMVESYVKARVAWQDSNPSSMRAVLAMMWKGKGKGKAKGKGKQQQQGGQQQGGGNGWWQQPQKQEPSSFDQEHVVDWSI